jgi:hypothetical protein
VQFLRRGRRLISRPDAFRAAYDAADDRLTLVGHPKFAQGGRLMVVASPDGLSDAEGVPVDEGGTGAPGDNGIFVIARKGKGISR